LKGKDTSPASTLSYTKARHPVSKTKRRRRRRRRRRPARVAKSSKPEKVKMPKH
jgi:hypothetical protein